MNIQCGIAMALFLSMPMIVADEVAPPSFSKGFEMLNALSPDKPAQNASWRKIEARATQSSQVLQELSGDMLGNAWFLAASGESAPMAIHFGNVVPQKIEVEELPPQGDLEKDIARILEAISKIERLSDPEEFRRPWGDGGSRTFGPLMIFAAQLHQAGHPKLADQLAWALFQAAPTRDVVVDAALDHLGNSLYNELTDRFFQSHDWQSYREDLTQLIEKLPRGWQAQPAAILTLESISLRVENPTPPKPEVDGIVITPAALTAISWMTATPETSDDAPPIPPELAEMLSQIPPEYHAQFLEHHGHGGGVNALSNPEFWLLNPPLIPSEKPGPMGELLTLGLEAIPVLAALATDSYPTHFPNPGGSRMSFSYSRSPAVRALETHASMSRPATRGDIARMMLTPILPDHRSQLRRADPHMIRDIAIEFYQAHHGKDAGQLAAVYLAEGDENQKTQAANFLATSSDSNHHSIFENHVINSPPASANLAAVITYAQQRKSDAKSLLEKFLPLVREEIGDGADAENNQNLPWQFRQPGALNQTLRQLEAIAEGKSSMDSALEIAAGPPEEAEAAIRALTQNLASEPSMSVMEILIAGAHAAEDPKVRFTFLGSMFHMRHFIDGDDDDGDMDQTGPTLPESTRQPLAALIADTHPFDTEWTQRSHFPADTLAEFAAMAVESRMHPGGIFELQNFTGILKQSLPDLCMARVKARLANEPLPALPNAENITQDRLREIVTTAGTKPAEAIAAYLDTLTTDERAAWTVWFEEPEDIEIPQSVRDLAFTIVEYDTSPQYGITPTPGLLNLNIGFNLHEDTIGAYIDDLAKNVKEHSLVMGTLARASFPPGITSWTMRTTIPEKSDDEDENHDGFRGHHFTPIDIFREFISYYMMEDTPEDVEAIITCQIFSDRNRNQLYWWVIDGQAKPFALNNRGELQEEIPTTLDETIASVREQGKPPMMTIHILSREDAEKLANR